VRTSIARSARSASNVDDTGIEPVAAALQVQLAPLDMLTLSAPYGNRTRLQTIDNRLAPPGAPWSLQQRAKNPLIFIKRACPVKVIAPGVRNAFTRHRYHD
jgi:hypothetical protein